MRRIFLATFLVLFVSLTQAQCGEKTAKILLVGKDRDHPYGTHEYMTECKLMANCLQQTKGISTVVSNGLPKVAKAYEGVKAIVLYTRNGGDVILSAKAPKQVRDLLKKGVGLTAIHWSTGAGKLTGEEYLSVLGGWFSRPILNSRLATVRVPLQQADPKNPICNGWKEFDLRDEYYLDLKFHNKIHPVLKVEIKDKEYTVGWVFERPHSKGRSFGFVCGHFHSNFGEKPFRQAIINGILWTAHLDVPAEGAPCSITAKDMALPPRKKK